MRTLIFALFGCAVLVAGARGQSTCDRIKTLIAQPAVAEAHWGISVTKLDGTPICGIDDGKLFRPASNNKIFTTAAALALLGPDKRFRTTVTVQGVVDAGMLKGNLVLEGGGDANFGTADVPYLAPGQRGKQASVDPAKIVDLDALADKVAATGLRIVDGDLVGDDSYFASEPYPRDWDSDDLVYGYGAPVSALSVHDNAISVVVSSRVTMAAIPPVPYYKLIDEVKPSGQAEERAFDCDAALEFSRAGRSLTVSGSLPAHPVECRQAIAIADPAEYAALAFRHSLLRAGVTVTGSVRAAHRKASCCLAAPERSSNASLSAALSLARDDRASAPAACAVTPAAVEAHTLAIHLSPTLIDDMTYTMKVSQNQHAETMLRNLGVAFCDGSQKMGLAVVHQFALDAGVQPGDIHLLDGSGMSTHDLVAPRAFTTFLAYAARQPWFAQWRATLPEGGVDGTLLSRFSGALKHRVFAKTGTFSESRALSGYVVADSGRTVIFSILDDNHLPGTAADRDATNKIVEIVAMTN